MWKLDWDDAFNNFVNVENPNSLIEEWRERSSSFKSNSTAIGKMELVSHMAIILEKSTICFYRRNKAEGL